MKKLVPVLCALILVSGSLAFVARPASAQGSAPDWWPKDYWDYVGLIQIYGQNFTATIHLEVKENVSVTVGGHNYDTSHCTMTIGATIGSSTISITSDIYLRTSDLADVKMVSTYAMTTTTVTYDPPLEQFRFPLSNGQTWTSTSNVTTTTGLNVTTDTVTNEYSVTGPTSITVPAGTFSAFTVTSHQQGTAGNSTIDYSDAVGSMTRIGGTFMGMLLLTPFLLKSFKYQRPGISQEEGFPIIPVAGILLLVIVVAVIASVLVMRRRRRARAKQQTQPRSTYGQPPQQPQKPPYQPPL